MKNSSTLTMRVLHRYLGFFLAGIMAVYAISDVLLIYRDTDFLKSEQVFEEQHKPNVPNEKLAEELRFRRLMVTKEKGDMVYIKDGDYNRKTGVAHIRSMELPYVLDKMTHLHKASTDDPLYYLNIFFGVSLLFFVVSAFWMFFPKTPVFKRSLLFSLAGVVLTLVLLFI